MKILHICLGEHYIDGYGYQENVLTKMHKQLGHDVRILASTETLVKQKRDYVEPSEYLNEYGIPIKRIPYSSWIPHKIAIKLRLYQGIVPSIEEFNPDILFIHSACFLGIRDIVKYVKKKKTTVFVDSHTDYVNSGKNWLSMNILHKIIYRYSHKVILPYTKKYYGTLPIRNVFLHDVYRIPEKKIEYLPMGIDLSNIDLKQREAIRQEMRGKYNIDQQDFVVVTGGKLEKRKNTIELMNAISKMPNRNIKLFLFGSISDNIKSDFDIIMSQNKDRIIYAGWAKWDEIYKYLFIGDLAIFPGTHSAIWEQTVGLGIPCVFKLMKNITQVDLGGNCEFIEEGTSDLIASMIAKYINNPNVLDKMKIVAEEKGPVYFSFEEIAKRAICD